MSSRDRDPDAPFSIMKCKVGMDGRWLEVSDRFCELLGYTREEMLERSFMDDTHPDDLQKNENIRERITKSEYGEFETTKRYITKSGESKWVYVSGALIKDKNGEPQYIVCYTHDVTAEKKSLAKIQESERMFRSLFEHNPHSVYYFDTEGNFRDANPKFEELSGYTSEELRGMSFSPFIAEKDMEKTWNNFQETLQGKTHSYEITGVTRSGERREARINSFPIIVGDEIVGVFGIAEDITESKEAKQKLQQNKKRWQHLVEDNPQPVQVTRDAEIIFINEAGAKLYGAQSVKEILGRSVFDFCHPESLEKVRDRKEKLERGENLPKIADLMLQQLNGELRYVEVHSIPITYKGKPAIQTVLHDVTDRKEKEEIIKTTLKEKEVMIKEIHHRVKNNMAVVSGLLELQTMSSENKEVNKILRESQHRIYSMAMIHEKLYQSESLSQIDFAKYIRELVSSINDTYNLESRDIEINYDIEEVILDVNKAIPCGLILNELVTNSYKHAFKGRESGSITIELNKEQDNVKLKVRDDGDGLPDDFKLEEEQGLGMTLVKTLQRQLDGELNFNHASNGSGVNFLVSFPLSA